MTNNKIYTAQRKEHGFSICFSLASVVGQIKNLCSGRSVRGFLAFVAIVAFAINTQAATISWVWNGSTPGGITPSENAILILCNNVLDIMYTLGNGTCDLSTHAGGIYAAYWVKDLEVGKTYKLEGFVEGQNYLFQTLFVTDVSGGYSFNNDAASANVLGGGIYNVVVNGKNDVPGNVSISGLHIVTSIPEPTTGLLLLSGSALLMLRRRSRQPTTIFNVTRN